MELYIVSKEDLSILSIKKPSDYEINLDEETNAKSTFILEKCEGLKKGNFIVINGLYKQFLFIIDDVQSEKSSNISTITALDISNIFDRKVIEKDTETMTSNSIEEFIANTISENFVNTDDSYIAISYIDIYWHTSTQAVVNTNAENGLYNFHTFLINCRQSKNICTDFRFENGRLRIDIELKEDTTKLIDATVAEITDYNKVYETDVTAKVQVLIREDNSIYNLYLKTDRTTTENKNDPDRANGKIETISVDTADKAREEALNVFKGNTYNHLVEFKIAKSSKLMDITQLYIGRNVRIKTDDAIYESYISAIRLTDENFVYFKSGNLRIDLLDKLKKKDEGKGNKVDCTGGVINGKLEVEKLQAKNGLKSQGTYNKGSWNQPKIGAVTQIIDDSNAQHSILVGAGENGKRYYGIDLLDDYENPIMGLYSGSTCLNIRSIADNFGTNLNTSHNIRWPTSTVNNVDSNNFKYSGMYYLGTNLTNSPGGKSYVRMFANGNNGGDIAQIGLPVSENEMWFRTSANNNWHNWKQVLTVESVTGSDGGICEKFANGTMIYRRTVDTNLACTQSWGNLYISQILNFNNYTIPFVGDPPKVSYSVAGGYSAWVVNCGGTWVQTVAKPSSIQLCRPTSLDSKRFLIDVTAIGRWK